MPSSQMSCPLSGSLFSPGTVRTDFLVTGSCIVKNGSWVSGAVQLWACGEHAKWELRIHNSLGNSSEVRRPAHHSTRTFSSISRYFT